MKWICEDPLFMGCGFIWEEKWPIDAVVGDTPPCPQCGNCCTWDYEDIKRRNKKSGNIGIRII